MEPSTRWRSSSSDRIHPPSMRRSLPQQRSLPRPRLLSETGMCDRVPSWPSYNDQRVGVIPGIEGHPTARVGRCLSCKKPTDIDSPLAGLTGRKVLGIRLTGTGRLPTRVGMGRPIWGSVPAIWRLLTDPTFRPCLVALLSATSYCHTASSASLLVRRRPEPRAL